ncbi:hypothetical protein GOODEAATRI_019926 [Goodea atripinnis]|uniref:Uncharacterized protein n=1 Tax=Goodea atripinnis TaxID=208336 RepID=A0ABV0NW40_9TELE
MGHWVIVGARLGTRKRSRGFQARGRSVGQNLREGYGGGCPSLSNRRNSVLTAAASSAGGRAGRLQWRLGALPYWAEEVCGSQPCTNSCSKDYNLWFHSWHPEAPP